MIGGEHGSLNVHVTLDIGKGVHLLQSIARILIEKMLMSGQYMLHQAILVSRSMWAESAFELWIDAAFEIVMPLQMMLMLVRFAAGGTGMLEYRNRRILGLHLRVAMGLRGLLSC